MSGSAARTPDNVTRIAVEAAHNPNERIWKSLFLILTFEISARAVLTIVHVHTTVSIFPGKFPIPYRFTIVLDAKRYLRAFSGVNSLKPDFAQFLILLRYWENICFCIALPFRINLIITVLRSCLQSN